jgi:hypothetical protein
MRSAARGSWEALMRCMLRPQATTRYVQVDERHRLLLVPVFDMVSC